MKTKTLTAIALFIINITSVEAKEKIEPKQLRTIPSQSIFKSEKRESQTLTCDWYNSSPEGTYKGNVFITSNTMRTFNVPTRLEEITRTNPSIDDSQCVKI
jgi:hypothetical protein